MNPSLRLRAGDVLVPPSAGSPAAGGAAFVLVLRDPDEQGRFPVIHLARADGRAPPLIRRDEAAQGTFDGDLTVASPEITLLQTRDVTAKTAVLTQEGLASVLRHLIKSWIPDFYLQAHGRRPYEAGRTPTLVSGRVIGSQEIDSMVDASLDGWLTSGRFNDAFERRLADFLGVRDVLTVNSGSSANLVAVATLCSPQLGEHALRPGDEVITVAAGFPTTVNPLLLYGLVPVFVDIELGTYNILAERVAAAVTSKTRAIVLAHTLGNPFPVEPVLRVAEQHGLWLVEDCCDALGSTAATTQPSLGFPGQEPRSPPAPGPRLCGTFGHLATFSFYPAHHITTGEGGAVATNSPRLAKIAESIRDWGRDCWCDPGKDNTCGKRFAWDLGRLPHGYDHKYIYSNLGFNLKMTDMQAAVGVAQMDRLPGFIAQRKANFAQLIQELRGLEDIIILPRATPGSDPSWFGFPITVRRESPVTRDELVRQLDQRRIGTRALFGGNLMRQPYMDGRTYRVHGDLTNTDEALLRTFWVGTYPGLGPDHVRFIASSIRTCLAAPRSRLVPTSPTSA